MSPKIVVVGSCMIDFTCFSPRLPKPGETIIGTRFEKSYGGKGANQCVTAAKLGGSTALIASLGFDTFAQEYLKIFKRENIDASHVKVQKDKHSGVAHIVVAENGENSIVIVLGANESVSPEQVDSAVDVIKSANVLLCQFEIPMETTLHTLKLYRGHGLSIVNGAPAVENPDPEILKLCDIFCVNETEAEIMTGVQPVDLSNVQQVADKLLAKGCNTIILTLGPLGAVYASKTNRNVTLIPTNEVHPVDSTGDEKLSVINLCDERRDQYKHFKYRNHGSATKTSDTCLEYSEECSSHCSIVVTFVGTLAVVLNIYCEYAKLTE